MNLTMWSPVRTPNSKKSSNTWLDLVIAEHTHRKLTVHHSQLVWKDTFRLIDTELRSHPLPALSHILFCSSFIFSSKYIPLQARIGSLKTMDRHSSSVQYSNSKREWNYEIRIRLIKIGKDTWLLIYFSSALIFIKKKSKQSKTNWNNKISIHTYIHIYI